MERRRGFTLIELLVVIAIIAILAVLVVTQLSGAQQKARNANAKSDVTEMGKSVELYKNDDNNPGASAIATSNTTGVSLAAATSTGTGTSIPNLFTGKQLYSSVVTAGTYSTGVTKTPSTSHIYNYRTIATGLTYDIWTTVTSGGNVTDTSFCVKNGTSLNGTAAATAPTNCDLL